MKKKAKKKVARKPAAKMRGKRVRIWTFAQNPFGLGGTLIRPVSTFVRVEGSPKSLGRGFYGYVVQSPDGRTVIAESTSGAIIGSSLTRVRLDVKQADLREMQAQIAHAQTSRNRSEIIDENLFWQRRQK